MSIMQSMRRDPPPAYMRQSNRNLTTFRRRIWFFASFALLIGACITIYLVVSAIFTI